MHRYVINFKKSAQDRAAEISARAYNHYKRFQPFVGKLYKPLREAHNKYLEKWFQKKT